MGSPSASWNTGDLRLALGFAGLPGTPELHLSVDGMTPRGPNLSHWPGNRTPAVWKRDLSTGICLAFARADRRDRDDFLGACDTVLNDHYDTDGFGSLLAVLRPDVAFAREELLLAAAATGDFGVFRTWRAFAIDRIVRDLAAARSPHASTFAGLDHATKGLRRYEWLLAHAEQVLDHPDALAVLYEAELAAVTEALDAGRRGAVQRTLHRDLGFAALTTTAPAHRMVLNTLAAAFRVLHEQQTRDGPLYRYHDRTESWFELATFAAPPRRDLRTVCAQLDRLEPPHDGGRWCADPPTEPIPELWFGEPSAQEYGEVTRRLVPSRLQRVQVENALAAAFAERVA